MKKILGIVKAIIVIILSIALIFNLFVLYDHFINHNDQPTVFGYTSAIVSSGSMEPVLHVDDLIITKAQDNYEIEDIIMFRDGESYVTHRIIAFDDGFFTTKGDANNAEDANKVSLNQIKGKLVLTLAGFGSVIAFVKSPLGMLIIIVLLIAIVLIPTKGSETDEEE